MLKDLSKTISEYISLPVPESKPIVGDSAYKHKAGTHLAAILRNPAAYEIIEPKVVGNRRKIVFGELAGKNGAAYLLSLLGLETGRHEAETPEGPPHGRHTRIVPGRQAGEKDT
jgi:2-isopropylmalate synthase